MGFGHAGALPDSVSENQLLPTHKPHRSKTARRQSGKATRQKGDTLRPDSEELSGPVRTAPAERRRLARQREREPTSPQTQTSPYQGGEEPPAPDGAPPRSGDVSRLRERETKTPANQPPRNLTQDRPRLSCLPDPAGSCPADRAKHAADLTADPPRFPATAETLPLLLPPPRCRRSGGSMVDGGAAQPVAVILMGQNRDQRRWYQRQQQLQPVGKGLYRVEEVLPDAVIIHGSAPPKSDCWAGAWRP